MKLIVAGIPAYNEEETIRRVVTGTARYVDKVFVVDDGSTDMTAKLAKEAGAILVRHKRRLGIGPARSSIMKKARELNADVLVMLDGDGQHDPNDIPKVIEPVLKRDTDVCVGYRMVKEGHMPLYRRLGLSILNKTISLGLGEKIRDTQSGFMAFSKTAMKKIKFIERGMEISVELWYQVVRKGLTFEQVPIVINYRGVRGSKINPLSHGLSIANLLVKRIARQRPFLFLGLPGLVFFLSGSVLMGIVMNTYFMSGILSLRLTILSVLAILLGVILILISIILFVLSDILMRIDYYLGEQS